MQKKCFFALFGKHQDQSFRVSFILNRITLRVVSLKRVVTVRVNSKSYEAICVRGKATDRVRD